MILPLCDSWTTGGRQCNAYVEKVYVYAIANFPKNLYLLEVLRSARVCEWLKRNKIEELLCWREDGG